MAASRGHLVVRRGYLPVSRGGGPDDHRSQLGRASSTSCSIGRSSASTCPSFCAARTSNEEYVRLLAEAARIGRRARSMRCRRPKQGLANPAAGSSSRRAVARGPVSSAWHRHGARRARALRGDGAGARAAPTGSRRPAAADLMILDVILPTFNREALLARTLDSLRAGRACQRDCTCACSSSTTRRPMGRAALVRARPPGFDGRLHYLFVPTPGKAARAERGHRGHRRRPRRPD